MSWQTLGLVGVLSWLASTVYECRFYWCVGVFDRRTTHRVAARLLSALGVRIVFLVGLAHVLESIEGGTATWSEPTFVVLGTGWFLTERLLRCPIVPLLTRAGPVGEAVLSLIENLLGLDAPLWADLRGVMREALIRRTAELRRKLGRATTELIDEHRKQIRRHLAIQRGVAWLIGGDWYRGHMRKDLDSEERHVQPKMFELVVNALGIRRLESHAASPEHQDEREFGRKLTLIPRLATLITASREEFRCQIIESSVAGLRLQAANLDKIEDGERITVVTDKRRIDCIKRWSSRDKGGFEVVEVQRP